MEGSPYREAALACPDCGAGPVRPFLRRLVCDACGGMLIGVADLAAALGHIASEQLVVAPGEPGERACPRCQRPLAACALAVGDTAIAGAFRVCERDGVWMPGGTLEAMFETLGREGHGRVVTPAHYGGVGTWIPLARRFAPRAQASPAYVSPLRDRRLACPACRVALLPQGELWPCPDCAGVFVENAALAGMIGELTGQPGSLPPPGGAAGPRACPVCGEPLSVESFGAVAIDRCAADGIWFDVDELARALHEIAEPPRGGLAGWLRRLWFRSGSPSAS
jgi:Zn-finger nucleic acid-binding protein